MGLPKISIVFKTAGTTAVQRGQKGVVALILKETSYTKSLVIDGIDKIPSESDQSSEKLSAANKEQMQLAMMGTVNPPKKVIAYVLPGNAPNYKEALDYLETTKWDYLVVPEITDIVEIAERIKTMRDTNGKKVKAVLPNYVGAHEGIINFATDGIKVPKKVGTETIIQPYTAAQYCSRIAGILAGMPLSISATYQVLPEVVDVPYLSKEELDAAIDNGRLVLFHDGEKVKIARAINSLKAPDKGEDFKKIKIVDTLDLIYEDIKRTCEDNYIGRVSNSYDHKCLLVSAIQAYFEALEFDGLLDKGKNHISIDVAQQKIYLKGIGVDVDAMDEQQIKEANTKDKVFLAANIKPLDAVEEITLDITL